LFQSYFLIDFVKLINFETIFFYFYSNRWKRVFILRIPNACVSERPCPHHVNYYLSLLTQPNFQTLLWILVVKTKTLFKGFLNHFSVLTSKNQKPMVLLIEKLAKHCFFKLENHHHPITHPQPEEFSSSSSLLAFKSHVSKSIDQLALDLKARSETLSLTWFERCLSLLPLINKAFATLVADMNYPMSEWEVGSTEGYLSYTLSLLELFNSISSCLSHLGQARISLAHGLTLVENSPSLARKHLKGIQFQQGGFNTNFGKDLDETRVFSEKERSVHEAVKEMKSVGFWVCGVLLTCLYGDGKSYMELRKVAGGFDSSLVATLDFQIGEQFVEKVPIFSEIKEVNDAVADLVAADEVRRHYAAKELQTKLQVLEKLSDSISKEVDNLFSNVMTQRSKLIDGFRLQQQPQKSSFWSCSICYVYSSNYHVLCILAVVLDYFCNCIRWLFAHWSTICNTFEIRMMKDVVLKIQFIILWISCSQMIKNYVTSYTFAFTIKRAKNV